MTTSRAEWQAETCHTGGYLCGHAHRSRAAAKRCLPRLPRGQGFESCYSMAAVVAQNAAAREIDKQAIQAERDADDRRHPGVARGVAGGGDSDCVGEPPPYVRVPIYAAGRGGDEARARDAAEARTRATYAARMRGGV